jgi:hypothetical protein
MCLLAHNSAYLAKHPATTTSGRYNLPAIRSLYVAPRHFACISCLTDPKPVHKLFFGFRCAQHSLTTDFCRYSHRLWRFPLLLCRPKTRGRSRSCLASSISATPHSIQVRGRLLYTTASHALHVRQPLSPPLLCHHCRLSGRCFPA